MFEDFKNGKMVFCLYSSRALVGWFFVAFVCLSVAIIPAQANNHVLVRNAPNYPKPFDLGRLSNAIKNGIKDPDNRKALGRSVGLHVALAIILGGVDYLLDPDNNGIKLKEPDPNFGKWEVNIDGKAHYYDTASQACNAFTDAYNNRSKDNVSVSVRMSGDTTAYCIFTGGKNKFNGNLGAMVKRSQNKIVVTSVSADQIADLMKKYADSNKPNADVVRKYIDEAMSDPANDPNDNSPPLDVVVTKPSPTDPNTSTKPSNCNNGYKPNDQGVCVPDSDNGDLGSDASNNQKSDDLGLGDIPNPNKDNPVKGLKLDPSIKDSRFNQHINFTGSCPRGNFEFTFLGRRISYPVPYHHFCIWLDQISYWLVGFTYLFMGYFVVRNL